MIGSMLFDCSRRSEFRNINIQIFLLREAIEKLQKAVSLNGSLSRGYFLLAICQVELINNCKILKEQVTKETKAIVSNYLDESKSNLEWVFKRYGI
jgi:hypothetical protein